MKAFISTILVTHALRTSAFTALFLVLLASATSATAQSLYVPYVRTTGVPYWESRLSLFNAGQAIGKAHILGIYGGGATLIDPAGCEENNASTLPNGGHRVNECVAQLPSTGVAFLEVSADPGILLQGDIYRSLAYLNFCVDPGVAVVPLARWTLPIFHGTFSAGTTVIAGEVSLGNLGCVPAGRTYPRRVNVTLFNAGTAPATFQIMARAYDDALGPPIYTQTITVSAKDVTQLNGIQSDFPPPAHSGDPEVRVWIRITADQPFLAYTSAIFNASPDGQEPFEVFEVQAPTITTTGTP
jgi:hypothetical protein